MNKNKVLIGLVVVLVLALLFVLFGNKIKAKMNNQGLNSIVYVTTGEVYVGKLKVLGGFEMTDVYLYQVSKDPTDPAKNSFQLQPLKDALWAPSSIHFEKSNIIFYGQLNPDSVIAKKLAEQK